MSKIIAYEIKLNGIETAVTNSQQLNEAIKATRKELNTKDFGTAAYSDLSKQLANLKNSQQDATAAIKQTQTEARATGTSYRALAAELANLLNKYKTLNEAERSADIGKQSLTQIQALQAKLKGLDADLGNYQRNVGNYKSAWLNTLTGIAPKSSQFFKETTDGTGAANVALDKLGIAAVGVGAIFGAFKFGGEVIKTTQEYEKLFAVLRQNTGSNFAALRTFAVLEEFAKNTPSQLTEVTAAYTKLTSRGINPNIKQLQALTDIASTSGKGLNQLVEAILDAQTGETERLKEFGVQVKKSGKDTDEMTVKFGTQAAQIVKGNDALVQYLFSLGKLPQIMGAGESIAQTLEGVFSNLEDSTKSLLNTLGEDTGLGDVVKVVVRGITGMIDGFNDFIKVPISDKLREQKIEFDALVTTLIQEKAAIDKGTGSISVRDNIIGELSKKYPDIIGKADLLNSSESQLNGILTEGNKLFERRIFLQATEEDRTKIVKNIVAAEKRLTAAQVGQNVADDRLSSQATGTTGFSGGLTGVSSGTGESLRNKSKAIAADINNTIRAEIKGYQDELKALDNIAEQTGKRLFGTLDNFKSEQKKFGELPNGKTGDKPKTGGGKSDSSVKAAESIKDELQRIEKERVEAIKRIQKEESEARVRAIDDDKQREIEAENARYNERIAVINDRGQKILDDAKDKAEKLKSVEGVTAAQRLQIVAEAEKAQADILSKSSNLKEAEKAENAKRLLDIEQKYNEKALKAAEEAAKAIEAAQKRNGDFLAKGIADKFGKIDQATQRQQSIFDGSSLLTTDEVDAINRQLLKDALTQKRELIQSIFEEAIVTNILANANNEADVFNIDTFKELAKQIDSIEKDITKTTTEENLKRRKEDEETAKRRIENEQRTRQAIKEASFDGARAVNDGIANLNQLNAEFEKEQSLRAIDVQYKAKLEAAKGNAAEEERLNAEISEKKKAIEIESIRRNAEIAKTQALIGAGLAIIQSLASTSLPFPASLAGPAVIALTTGFQVAAITKSANTQIAALTAARGGAFETTYLQGERHGRGGTPLQIGNKLVEVERGEAIQYDEDGRAIVINRNSAAVFREQLQAMQGQLFNGKGAALSYINSYNGYGQKFAMGGAITPNYLPIVSPPQYLSQPTIAKMDNETINKLAAKIGEYVKEGAEVGTHNGAISGTYSGTVTAANEVNRISERQAALIQKTNR